MINILIICKNNFFVLNKQYNSNIIFGLVAKIRNLIAKNNDYVEYNMD
jgi:hypothetical protein